MGEIAGGMADDMIDGACCSICGKYFDDEGDEIWRVCIACSQPDLLQARSEFDEAIDAPEVSPRG